MKASLDPVVLCLLAGRCIYISVIIGDGESQHIEVTALETGGEFFGVQERAESILGMLYGEV